MRHVTTNCHSSFLFVYFLMLMMLYVYLKKRYSNVGETWLDIAITNGGEIMFSILPVHFLKKCSISWSYVEKSLSHVSDSYNPIWHIWLVCGCKGRKATLWISNTLWKQIVRRTENSNWRSHEVAPEAGDSLIIKMTANRLLTTRTLKKSTNCEFGLHAYLSFPSLKHGSEALASQFNGNVVKIFIQ